MGLTKKIAVIVAMSILFTGCTSRTGNDLGAAIAFAPIALIILVIHDIVKKSSDSTFSGEAKPPSAEIRQRMDRIVVRVLSPAEPVSHASSIAETSNAGVEQVTIVRLEEAGRKARPVIALHNQVIRSIQEETSSTIVEDKEPTGSRDQPVPDKNAPLVLGIEISEFSFRQNSSDLWLHFAVTAGIFDAPEVGSLYNRKWQLDKNLGAFRTLKENNFENLEEKIEYSIQKMASAIVDDIFISEETKDLHSYSLTDGKVVTSFAWGTDPLSASKFDQDLMKDAICGDSLAQWGLGNRYAAIDSRIYGRTARRMWIEAYKWLRLSQIAGNNGTAAGLDDLKEKLTAEEIASATELVAKFKPLECGKELDKKTQTTRIATSDSEAATKQTAPSAVETGPCEPGSHIDFSQDRAAIEEVLSAALDTSGGYNQRFHEFKDIRERGTRCGEIEITTTYTLEQTYWGGTDQYIRKAVLIKKNNEFFVEHIGN